MSRMRWQALGLSVLLHLAILLVGVFSVSLSSPMAMPRQLAIEATVVDASVLEAFQQSQLETLEQAERERQARLAREREAREIEARLERERREAEQRAVAEELAREADAARRAEEKRLADERAREAEVLEKERLARAAAAEAERERQEELKRQREAEAKRLAEAKRQQQEAEARRRREAEARRQAEAEALLLAQLEEEERRMQASRAGLRDQYALLIKQKIERNWLRPASAAAGLECDVAVTQLPSREVVDVRIGKCNADAATLRSIEAAVYKASPLPEPPDPSLFERKLTIIFKPDG